MVQRLGRRWRAVKKLTWVERRLLAETLLLLPVITLALRLIGFQRTQTALARVNRPPLAGADGGPLSMATLAYIVGVAGRYAIGRPQCLPLALVLWWLLHRQGLPAELRIGVRKRENQIEAHAWVECDGVTIDVTGGGYQGFASFERAVLAEQRGAS